MGTPVAKKTSVLPDNSEAGLTTPMHDKDMARAFLAGLDPTASKFTFQFFKDCGEGPGKKVHGTLDEVWPQVQAQNMPQRGVGVFVTINETDFKGRKSENIVRPRALFVDADNKEQGERCVKVFKECGVTPSLTVESGRGRHFYFCADDIPRDQFSALQKLLIAKVRTDGSIHDLPRVMRLPGTLHLKNPAEPRFVELLRAPVLRWKLPDLIAKLGLSPASNAGNDGQVITATSRNDVAQSGAPPWAFTTKPAAAFAHLPVESLAAGLETDIEEIGSAAAAIPASAISTEQEWMKFARALAHEAARFPGHAEQLWVILDSVSRAAPNYNAEDNHKRWLRYISEAFSHQNPITIATLFALAKQHGWPGWSPPIIPAASQAVVWSEAELKIAPGIIPHRRWLYGTYLLRGEVTVLAAPGGAGKTALATGIAVEIATGIELLGEKIYKDRDLKVLFINGEDSKAEIDRRRQAFCLAHAHKLIGQSLDRFLVLGADNPKVKILSFLKTDKAVSMLNQSGFDALGDALDTLRPDLVVIDPLVAFCGGGNMNDNSVMSLVVRELKLLAVKLDCAVMIVHHTKKGGDVGNAEAISGAAAIVNLARRAIMPVPMTEHEANKFAVLPSERFRYFKVVDAKSNFAPRSADSPWYQLHSIELLNPEPPIYPHGDNVQAIARTNLSLLSNAAATADDQKIQRAIMDLVVRCKVIDGQPYPYSPTLAGADNERALLDDAMAAVRDATAPRSWLADDLKAATAGAIKKMKKEGLLEVKDMKELMREPGRFRRGRGLRARSANPIDLSVTVTDEAPNSG